MTFRLDPAEVLDFAVDWDRSSASASAGSGKLAAGETISTSTWTIPTGLVEDTTGGHAQTSVAGKTTIWLKVTTAVVGDQCWVTNHITTSQGRQYDKQLRIDVVNK